MNLLNAQVNYYEDDFRRSIEPTALGFLRQLNGLSVFDLKGKDTSRTRVVTTLIHGNEPSGLIASHLWLLSKCVPITNIRIILCNPEAARTKPIFTHRYLGQFDDLNRYFSAPSTDLSEVAERARQISLAVKEVNPESIIDLHNTSGTSPAFGVALSETSQILDLVSLFSSRLILTGLRVGAIMEQSFDAPIATIECGGANEVFSHQIATDGLNEYFTRDELFDNHANRVEVHRQPLRVELLGDASVGFSHTRLPTTDITLRADVEQLNQQYTPAGEFLGWCEPGAPLLMKALDEDGVDQIHKVIEEKNGCLFAARKLQLFMVTTTAEIATNDCLFYATAES